MLITTVERLESHKVKEPGLVQGCCSVKLRNLAINERPESDKIGWGAEEAPVTEQACCAASKSAQDQMAAEAERLKADAVLGVRLALTTENGFTVFLAYGTAVRFA